MTPKKTDGLWLEYMPLEDLERWPRNPRIHDKDGIASSVHRYGYTAPVTIDERTGKLVAGHGRLNELQRLYKAGKKPPKNIKVEKGLWKIPVIRGNKFKNGKELEAYLLDDNKISENGSWNLEMLDIMIPEVEPIAFDVQEALEAVSEAAEEVNRTSTRPTTFGVSEVSVDHEGNISDESAGVEPKLGKDNPTTKLTPDLDDIPGILKGIFQIDEDIKFPIENDLGIPELRLDMILEEFPPNLHTWADWQSTPDSPDFHWLCSVGVASTKGLPYDRAIMAWFAHDKLIETLWNTAAYRVGQLLTAKVIAAVVPDFSLWEGFPKVLHIHACYRAQWMGRLFQECGLKVVPRFEYFLPEAREFSLIGVPKNSPTLATQLHTGFEDEHIPLIKESLMSGLDILRPRQFLVYAGNRGREIIEDLKLPCEEVIILPTIKLMKPQTQKKEEDPYLVELRKRKKGRERA